MMLHEIITKYPDREFKRPHHKYPLKVNCHGVVIQVIGYKVSLLSSSFPATKEQEVFFSKESLLANDWELAKICEISRELLNRPNNVVPLRLVKSKN